MRRERGEADTLPDPSESRDVAWLQSDPGHYGFTPGWRWFARLAALPSPPPLCSDIPRAAGDTAEAPHGPPGLRLGES